MLGASFALFSSLVYLSLSNIEISPSEEVSWLGPTCEVLVPVDGQPAEPGRGLSGERCRVIYDDGSSEWFALTQDDEAGLRLLNPPLRTDIRAVFVLQERRSLLVHLLHFEAPSLGDEP